MVEPDASRHPRPSEPGAAAESSPGRVRTRLAQWYRGSFAKRLFARLDALDFTNQIVLFGSGLLVTLLPLLMLLSAFANERVDDDIALHLGLDHRAATIVSNLFNKAPAQVNGATITSLIFMLAGTLAMVSSLQQIYEKVFDQSHRGMRDLPRFIVWVAVLCATVGLASVLGPRGGLPVIELVTFAIFTPFVWWTMHFLLAGRVPWRRLFPSAVATGLFAIGLGVFSHLYFSSTIISDHRIYGPIGAMFSILTWLVAIAAVIILGAVAGALWHDRPRSRV
ncbi:MAG TPA: YhjD/YihY/BrkB family envelope integrity protein [Acidimicrobiia bacterium]|nr:YhjD/YihY/BrkB family envelope integrity protein [Acidimicrobiia bacterium]